MKSESVVIADQQAAVNTFSGLVHTARQANKVGGGRRAPQGELSRIQRWGLSRNKVSLAEAGDGSPPFYFIKLMFLSMCVVRKDCSTYKISSIIGPLRVAPNHFLQIPGACSTARGK